MSEQEKQKFVAYGQEADQVIIRFYGGPLDGAEAVTDERPAPGEFVHRVGTREYVYAFRMSSSDLPNTFEARLVSESIAPTFEEEDDSNVGFRAEPIVNMNVQFYPVVSRTLSVTVLIAVSIAFWLAVLSLLW